MNREFAPKLRVRNLNFYYGAFLALKNVTLDVAEHKVTAIIGPSGCGKSTLLRTLNRMYSLYPEQRAEGEIVMDGENLLASRRDIALIRAKIGMVFQKPTPFPMSIYENIAFGVRLFERPGRREMDERVEWALTRAAATASRAASSSGCASRARSPSGQRCCCSTSRARRSTRSRPRASRS